MDNSITPTLDSPRTSIWVRTWTYVTKPAVSIILILITGTLARLSLLSRDYPLSFDDGVYAMSIKHVANGSVPFKDTFSSQGPYFLEIAAVPARIFGDSFWTYRFVPFLAGLIASVVVLLIARRFMTPGWALAAGLITAVSGTLLRSTTPITSDGVLVAATVTCVLLAYLFVDKPTYIRAVFLGLVIGFGCGIKSIFMIPTLIFVLVVTWKTSWLKRITAGAVAVGVYAAPFLIFGVSNTAEQSIFYHLDKTDKLNIGDNISKIVSTTSSFDTGLFVFMVISIVACIFYAIKTKYFSRISKKWISSTIFNTHNPLSFLFFFFVPTLLLVSIQAPLFRNHLAILIPPMAIFTCWSMYKLTLILSLRLKIVLVTVFTIVVLLGSLASYNSLMNDSLIKHNQKFDAVVKALNGLPDHALILTNEPGIAWAAQLDVPVGLEDTSRYRFSSPRKDLQLNEDTMRVLLKNENICAIVHSPEQNPPVIDWSKVAPASWTIAHETDFIVWLNPSPDCSR